jgi:hypothetical protein
MYIYTAIITIHSILRWIILFVFIYSLIILFYKWFTNKELDRISQRINTFVVVLCHLQIVIGFSLYFVSPKVVFASYMFKSSLLRFFTLEHVTLMTLAIILLTIGNIKSKNNPDKVKAVKQCALWFTVSFLIIILSIPWPFLKYGTHWI